jgi:osmotically inducible protein OsmC
MATRKAEARWTGELKTGTGHIRTGSGAFEGTYSFTTRFQGAPGANPEELLGAAHAGCFSMALNNSMFQAGHAPKSVFTTAEVQMDMTATGTTIVGILLTTEAEVPGMTAEQFNEFAETAKTTCIISRALSVPMTVKATLRS